MAQAYRTYGQVSSEGSLRLENLPFQPGEAVEVIVLAEERPSNGDRRYPLRGKPVIYHDPTSPVGEADWNAVQ